MQIIILKTNLIISITSFLIASSIFVKGDDSWTDTLECIDRDTGENWLVNIHNTKKEENGENPPVNIDKNDRRQAILVTESDEDQYVKPMVQNPNQIPVSRDSSDPQNDIYVNSVVHRMRTRPQAALPTESEDERNGKYLANQRKLQLEKQKTELSESEDEIYASIRKFDNIDIPTLRYSSDSEAETPKKSSIKDKKTRRRFTKRSSKSRDSSSVNQTDQRALYLQPLLQSDSEGAAYVNYPNVKKMSQPQSQLEDHIYETPVNFNPSSTIQSVVKSRSENHEEQKALSDSKERTEAEIPNSTPKEDNKVVWRDTIRNEDRKNRRRGFTEDIDISKKKSSGTMTRTKSAPELISEINPSVPRERNKSFSENKSARGSSQK